MEILSRVLPAVRETRVPLLTGYAWFVALLVVFTAIAPLQEAVSASDAIADLRNGVFRSELALAAATGVVAYLLGSLSGFVWDRYLPPLDPRALRDRAAQRFAEAQLRLQLVVPLLVIVAVLAARVSPLIVLGVVPLAVIGWHGRMLWQEAYALPLSANLVDADLSHAYLVDANLTHVNLTGTNLRGANLTRANLTGTKMAGAELADAVLDEVELFRVGGGLVASDLFRPRSMKRASFAGVKIFGNLRKVRFIGVDFSRTDFSGADLSASLFIGCELAEATFNGADLTAADLSQNYLGSARNETVLLLGARFFDAKLYQTNFEGADLHHAIFRTAMCCEAKFSGANLRWASFDDGSVVGISFDGDLKETTFRGADITGSDFTNAAVRSSYFEGARWHPDYPPKLPDWIGELENNWDGEVHQLNPNYQQGQIYFP